MDETAANSNSERLDSPPPSDGRRRRPARRVRRGKTLPQLLAAAVERDPAAIACVFEGREVSYEELDRQTSRLARLLIDRGIGPEDIVAVGIPRSIESVMAVWSVAKSGAGFVPVDPAYPPGRVAHMVTDSGAKVGLTVSAVAAELPTDIEWLVLDSPEVSAALAGFSDDAVSFADRSRVLQQDHPAYVIYTSGSTGTPKGVVVTHAGLGSLCDEQRERYEVGGDSRTLHFASPSFDASVLELLLAIGAGATMVIAPTTIYGGDELADLLRRERVTHAFVTPAALASMHPVGLDDLRVVVTGGEAWSPELVGRFVRGPRKMFNAYGPTETTVVTNISEPLVPGEPVTIGAAIRGTGERILDSRLQPVPVDTGGELYVYGPQLARGYHDRASLTAARFVADPLGEPGSRLYRTGDLVRSRPNGMIEFVGRSDQQVKVRGYRIELGEIDAAFAAHPDIEFAATLGRESATGETILVSYVLVEPDRPFEPDELTAFVSRTLPAHMVPLVIMKLDSIPLTGAGKLDRKSLPEPIFEAREYEAPEGSVEEIVAEVFVSVLPIEQVGRHDNFMELGGNSLIATQVTARLNALLDARLPARMVFEHPTVAGLAAAIEPKKGEGARPAITPRTRPERIPLSLAQQRLWFLNRFDPTSAANNVPVAIRLSGDLDVAALQAAVTDVLDRHEALRTSYPDVGGRGYQQIHPVADVSPDLTPTSLSEDRLLDWVRDFVMRGFDVTREVPLRMALLRLAPAEHVLALVVHHIAADGVSMAPLVRDVVVAYTARRAGTPPKWMPLPIQYADYTLWQRELLGVEEDPNSLAAHQTAYWRTKLAGLPDRLDLPADRQRPSVESNVGALFHFEIAAATDRRIREVARENDASPFMVVHAALAVLLARMSATSDIVIGTPIAGRGEAALDDMVGMFVNTLAMRLDVRDDLLFTDLLIQARKTDLDAFSNADLPFERLLEILNPVRSAAHHPLFQVALFFQNMERPTLELPGLTVGGVDFDGAAAKFDLQLTVSTGSGVGEEPTAAMLTYATDLFDESTVAKFADRFLRILDVVAVDPDVVVGDIDILDSREALVALRDRNATAHAVEGVLLLDGFDRQVLRSPDAVAVASDDGQLTYAEFDARVNQLARDLISRGVGAESLVGIAIRRSVDLVVAMYAVVRAGGAYVPLDPDHPAERIAHILATANPVCVLSTSRDEFATTANVEVVSIDSLDLSTHSGAPVRSSERLRTVRPESPAYVIFTSGSTGMPKGVAVSHAAIVNQLEWMQAEYGLVPTDVYLQKTATTFDVSLWGFFMPLRVGATLLVAAPDGHRDPQYLAETIAARQVTVTDFVPSMLAVFAAHVEAGHLESLRHVFVIGEALPPATVAAFAEVSGAAVHNLYGPTEAAVSVTYSPAASAVGAVPIGLPEWNTQIFVLDSRLHPVPDGVPGELYLGGGQLARGYVSRPDLTSDRFVANPFGGPGARMYRTGDLVRWHGAGGLDYIGRTDFQVKFRGQRIELGEIETALLAQPGVTQAAALVMTAPQGDQLVGYVVGAPAAALDGQSLRSAVGNGLPPYMVPSAIVVLDEFPLNTSGKLDRKALPSPTLQDREFRAPTTPVQEIVAGVFADVLGIERVGLDDDFFALGGNSLIATQVVARLGATLDTRVPVRMLFESSTVAALAAAAESHTGDSRLPLGRQTRPERIPLSLAQQRMWFLNRFDSDSAVNNLPIAIRLSGELDVTALRDAVTDVLWRHESLRTLYPEYDGTAYQQIVSAEVAVPDLTPVAVAADDILSAVGDFVSRGFDVTTQVPVRAQLFALDARDHVLAVVVHHISGDGFSMGPLTRDVMVAYLARTHGDAPNWEPLPVQYADFAIWQREVLGSLDDPASLISQQIDYWRTRLSGLPDQLDLPVDRPRPAIASNRGADFAFAIDADLHTGMNTIAKEHHSTTFMVAHALLAVLLARLSGTTDIAIGTPVAGRGEQALDDVVGMFVNTLVLRTEVDPNSSFTDLLERARETDLGAFGHADLPFERLVEVLNPERSQARHPLFQVMLTFQNLARTDLTFPELQVSAVDFDLAIAKFDLQVTLSEHIGEHGEAAGMSGVVTYATDLFDEATIATFVEQFDRVLRAVVGTPDIVVGDIAVLDAAEHDRLLHDWNEPGSDVADATLIGLFGVQARRTPDRVAVVHDGRSLTYSDLSQRVNRLARKLIAEGVGAESLVAVALPRSLDLVVALLAVLEAGGAYLPIDVTYPAERLAFMLSDSKPVCAVTTAASGADLPVGDVPIIDLDAIDLTAGDGSALEDDERRRPLRPANTAYVIYTSGSTGTPKGVLVPHANVVRLFANTRERFGFDETDVWTLFHSYAFDFSVWELWGPLLHGGKLVVVDYFTSRTPEEFLELLRREGVTVLNQTPTAFYQLIEADRADRAADPLQLRHIIFGGEALDLKQLARWYDRHDDASPRLVNMYGITETTVHVSYLELTSSMADGSSASVIGRAVPGLGVYVLDSRLHPTPVNVPGEIYVTGGQLARGYLGRPELSAGRFVADPFGAPGAKMYRTGDVARWNAAGQLEYAGRSDSQVQLRGFRIELGEIESVLKTGPGVANAVAAVWTGENSTERLIGYVVTESGAAVDTAAVLEHVSGFLTDYMVPDALVVLDALPLTANGKLDRKALPAPKFVSDRPFRAPETPMETTIAEVFADVLGVDRVGVEDSFFALGGDSIVSIQLVSRAKARGVYFTPRNVFEQKTVRGLAEVAVLGDDAGPIVLEELPGGGVGDMPLTPIVSFMVQRGGGFDRYTQSIALELPRGIDRAGLSAALKAVIDRHDMLRAKLFRDPDGEWQLQTRDTDSVAVDDLIAHVPFEASSTDEDLVTLAHSELEAAAGRLAPADGVVLQFVWLDPIVDAESSAGSRSGRLIIVAHHLVIDGVSWRIIIPDLVSAWAQLLSGAEPVLAAVGTSMRRWAHGLADRAHSDELLAELPAWRKIVDVADPLLGDRPLDATVDLASTVEKFSVTVPEPVTDALLTDLPRLYHGAANDGLLAGLALALLRWRQRRGIDATATLVSLEGHGREEDLVPGADLARTVGWFTSIFPVGIDLRGIDVDDAFAGGPAAGAAVKAVKEQLLAVPNRGVGFGVLKYLAADHASDLASARTGEISFNYLGRISAGDVPEGMADFGWMPAGDLGDLSVSPDADMPAMAAIDINAVVLGGSLRATFGFPTTLLDNADVTELADHWMDALTALAAHTQTPGAGGLTPSDVNLVQVRQRDLESFESRFAGVVDVWPLAPLQSGLLFHALLADASVDMYSIQMVLDLAGVVDAARLRGAAQGVLDRYANLRTAFVADSAGEPVSVVLEDLTVPWREVDLSDIDDEVARDEALAELLAADAAVRFDMAVPPLIRFTLVKVTEGVYKLVMANHHILLDGWSMPLLMKDLLVLYATRGDASVLGRVRSYRSYLAWLGEQDPAVSMRAWAHALEGAEPTILVPQRAGSEVISARTGEVEVFLDEADMARLSGLAARVGVTVNTVVQAGWGVVLGRLTGRSDVVFGATVSGRPAQLAGVESMVGLFINTLPVRVGFDPNESVESLLVRLQGEQADLLDHHHVGLADIQRAVGAGSLFDTLTVFESYPVDTAGLADQAGAIEGMSIEGVSSNDAPHYPLSMVINAGARLTVTFEYLQSLLDEETVTTIAGRLIRALAAFLANSAAAVGDVELLAAGERELLVSSWALAPGAVVDPNVTLVSLFDAQVAATPDAVAVCFEDASLTYAELDTRANALARQLISVGVGPESLVGVVLGRSLDVVVAILAVLKAGGGYVPVDPTYPAERIAYTLTDSAPVCVLTDSGSVGSVPESVTAARVLIDEVEVSEFSTAPISDADRLSPLRSQDVAYVIYTSGSTGRPKGVAVTHRNVVELMANAAPKFGFDSSDVWTMFHSPAFDFSVWELWGPLLFGGRLVVVDYFTSRSPQDFVELVRREGVTVLNQTPSAFYQFAEAERVAAEAGADRLALRHIVFGGEALDLGRLSGWVARYPHGPQLVNMYGITETTVHVSFVEVTAELVAAGGASVIGRGLPGLGVFVLDSRLAPVPVGAAGEVYVSGEQLSRGYVGRAALSAGRFVANPFGQPGSRLYRTGDVARWNAQGQLEYAGRSDAQVQLRGFRIELGEIESVLASFAGVASAVAVVRTDELIGDRLVGYVVPQAGASVDPVAVTEFASGFLTSYMVPDAVVVLDALPLTVNGKLDRRALPAPEFVSEREFREPRTPIELSVAEVFARVLGVERIGLDDDFFALGGNSLIATKVVAQIQDSVNPRMRMQYLFSHRTVGELAELLSAEDPSVAGRDRSAGLDVLLPIRTAGSDAPLFCVHPMSGLSWQYFALAQVVDPAHPLYGLQSPSILDASVAPQSIAELAAVYVREARRVQPSGPYHLLGWSFGGVLAHAMAVELEAAGETVSTLALVDSVRQIDLAVFGSEMRDELRSGGIEIAADQDFADFSLEQAQHLVDVMGAAEVGLTAEQVQRMFAFAVRSPHLINDHQPGVFGGDLLFFSAEVEHPTSADAALTWQPFVGGEIVNHTVPTNHGAMLGAESLSVVGPLLDGWLRNAGR
ncbi:amino acid adenylation domain-containing protein [Nocardiaceae bacterium YC2-7]|uniref:Amino acid adenylation domain-containing protein n=2 Tax=Antrihabitans stalactiti TaxID=2584121 RepID=A0A848KF27_9NOCA|nr:amino acid adenylation domain-containing protein [Antrihabitans stalactiti]